MTIREQIQTDLRTAGPYSPEEWHAERTDAHRFNPNVFEKPPTLTEVRVVMKKLADDGHARFNGTAYEWQPVKEPVAEKQRQLF